MPLRGVNPRELAELGIREYRQVFFKPYRIIHRVVADRVYIAALAHRRGLCPIEPNMIELQPDKRSAQRAWAIFGSKCLCQLDKGAGRRVASAEPVDPIRT